MQIRAGKGGSMEREGGPKTGGPEQVRGIVQEICGVFPSPGLCSLENHSLASLISLVLQVLLFKHHFLIPHTAFKKNEAKLSLGKKPRIYGEIKKVTSRIGA